MACTFRMTYEEAARQPVSVRAQECCAHFGYPYQAIVVPNYRPEVARLRRGACEVGCLNQHWAGPLLVWYPEGDWVSATHTGEVVVYEEV
jgi:hypothetical protein